MSLTDTGPSLYEWVVLRWVRDGGVVEHGGRYTHQGCPVLGEVAAALDRLHRAECLALHPVDAAGHQTVCLTRSGLVRYAELHDLATAQTPPAGTPRLPEYRQIVDLAELVLAGNLTSHQRRMVSRLVEQLGFMLRVALQQHAGRWEPLAETYAGCTAAVRAEGGHGR